MNKSELLNATQSAIKPREISKAAVEDILDAFIDVIGSSVKGGEEVRLKGFGSFKLANRSARKGRNPQTGETIDIPAKTVVKFVPSKNFGL